MANKKPGSMVIHLDEADLIRRLSDRDRGRLFLALVNYAQDGLLPEGFKGALDLCFDVMRRSIDRNVVRYNETCERNRALAMKRWHPEEAEGCEGMPAYAPDANRNPNVTPNQNKNLTVTPAEAAADTAAAAAAKAAATAEAAAEAQISFACERKRELLARFMRGDKRARAELDRLEIELAVLQAELDRQRGQ